jgi:hypothetical protein
MGDRNVYPLNGPGRGDAGTRKVIGVRGAAILTTDLTLNRTVGLCVVPAGFVVTGHTVVVTDLDTGGSPAVAFTIGDAGDPDRLATAATTAQAGGTLTTLAAAGLYYKYTTDTEIYWTTSTAAATAAAGTITYQLEGYME